MTGLADKAPHRARVKARPRPRRCCRVRPLFWPREHAFIRSARRLPALAEHFASKRRDADRRCVLQYRRREGFYPPQPSSRSIQTSPYALAAPRLWRLVTGRQRVRPSIAGDARISSDGGQQTRDHRASLWRASARRHTDASSPCGTGCVRPRSSARTFGCLVENETRDERTSSAPSAPSASRHRRQQRRTAGEERDVELTNPGSAR